MLFRSIVNSTKLLFLYLLIQPPSPKIKIPQNSNVNKLNSNLSNSLGGLSFGIDGDGNYGYYGADGSLVPFSDVVRNMAVIKYWTSTTPDCIDSEYFNFISDTRYDVLKDIYNAHMFLGYTQGQSGSNFTSYIYKNGTQIASHHSSTSTPTDVACVNLKAGDIITFSYPAPAYGGSAAHNFITIGSKKANFDIFEAFPSLKPLMGAI